ncbi:unnamed protein product [Rotaria sordida]|uniref:Protein sleepless n=1 Tax=Rotaria sordida TaxID=392033 RepID=A0A813ZW21_9BILA|nr:unnamed protein product [Rotaria sordida]
MKYLICFIFIFGIFINISNSINCFVCDSKEDEHCPETWTRKDILPIECGGPDGVQDARFCIKTIAVFGGAVATKRFCSSRDMDNQCIEVKYPQDEKMYYSCTYTCSHDGCNGTSHLNISAIFVLFLILIQFFCV